MATFQPTINIGEALQLSKGNHRVHTVGAIWNRGTTALATNDVLAGPYLPAGARVLDVRLRANDCETSTAALTLSVGDSGSAARFISADTVGRAGGITSTMATAGIGYKYTAETQVNVTVAAGATAAGSSDPQYIILLIDYILEE